MARLAIVACSDNGTRKVITGKDVIHLSIENYGKEVKKIAIRLEGEEDASEYNDMRCKHGIYYGLPCKECREVNQLKVCQVCGWQLCRCKDGIE